MKIIFVAVFNENSTNNSQLDGLISNNCEVEPFNYREIGKKYGEKNRDQLLIDLCNKIKPNAIIFSKCNEIDISVIDECNKVCKTILWYMDPVNSQFNESLVKKIKKCTYTYCALWDSYIKAKKISQNNVFFLHEGFDHLNNYPINCEYKYDVSFIGNLREHRLSYYKEINFDVISNAYGINHSMAVSSSKINLNFTHGGTSDRTYKVLASKGFLLTEPWPNMSNDFTIGEDLVIFESINDLKDKIKFYLNNESERFRISENGYNKVQKFSRVNWASEIIKNI